MWVRLPSLPLNCWGGESLSKIGSTLGVPLYADECTTQQLRVSFARMLIEMDVTKPLPDSILIEDPNGEVRTQMVQYDWRFVRLARKLGMIAHPRRLRPSHRLKKVHGSLKTLWLTRDLQCPPIVAQVAPSPAPVTTITPAVTSQVITSDDAGWKVVSRRTRDRGQ